MALQSIVLAARAVGIAVFDGVFNRLEDEDGFAAEAAEGRLLGFDGKSLILPSQSAPCHAAGTVPRSRNQVVSHRPPHVLPTAKVSNGRRVASS